ncbi:acetate--CoA ligase family protein [Nocardia jiangxiensis]|uniref:Acetate--CoA ligase family protein n=1 Tax=Nocardia jiangxiensis TaxID=282685 RepID=A0ABW6SAG9_9NOCA|nr:acetate--CoA ligase family protein [Nocardia jiangxiensis]
MPNGPALDLDPLFRPKTIAVVGATNDEAKIGSLIIPNLRSCGYSGVIYPVNPSGSEVAGLKCVASPADLPPDVDVAYILVPAHRAVDAARGCADNGVKFAIISAAGFAESGTIEGAERQEALAKIVRDTGMRIIGPNCNGIYNANDGVSIGFNASHSSPIQSGPLALISHSGALFDALARRARSAGLGLSKFVSVGNEADLDLLDYLAYLIDDRATEVIGLVVDAIPDGDRFRQLVRTARQAGKQIIALKFGQSAVGAVASQAHSSRLAGGPRATDALLDMLGVVRVTTVESLICAGAMVVAAPKSLGRHGVAGVTMSGAAGAILADGAERYGLRMSEFTDATRAVFAEQSRLARVVNPVDLGAIGSMTNAQSVLNALFHDSTVSDVVVTPHNTRSAVQNGKTAQRFARLAHAAGKRLTVIVPGGLDEGTEDVYREGNAVLVRDTDSTLQALAAIHRAQHGGSQDRGDDESAPPMLARRSAQRLREPAAMTEPECLDLLAAVGVPTVQCRTLHQVADIATAGRELGWPLVLKGAVPGVTHKSELGLVELGVADETTGAQAFHRLSQRMASAGGGEIIAEQTISGRFEAIAGISTDPILGQFVLLGIGGIFTEDLDNVVLIPADAGRDHTRARVLGSAVGQVLDSARWALSPTEAVLDIIYRLQTLARSSKGAIRALDINPLVIGDGTATAVDAVITRGTDLERTA